MSQNGDLIEYSLVNAEGEALKNSRGYTGKGTATYPNSDSYTGDFNDGVRQGTGIYTYTNKLPEGGETPITYSGQWHGNKKHGIGMQKYVGVGDYYGYWENGNRHGEGVMTYLNSDVYSGNWANGNKEGKGTYIVFKTGEKYVGIYKNGQLVSGKWIYPNGSYFEGKFNQNKPKGAGKWVFANGNVVEGEYTQTKRADVEGMEVKLSWKTTSDITKSSAVSH